MNYFIDFEATQFSNEIISVGCIDETGTRKFYSLVKSEKKITPFITHLTGLTDEQIAEAPSSDSVFSDFYDWIIAGGDDKVNFYCYGNSDINFIQKNLKKSTALKAQIALSTIGMNLIDYSIGVREHFGITKAIGLKKIVAYYRGVDEIHQNHNALEDAEMLKEVYDNIQIEGVIQTCPFPEYVKKTTPKKIAQQNQLTAAQVIDMDCKIERISKNKVLQVYGSGREAAEDMIKNFLPGVPNNVEAINVVKKILTACRKNSKYNHFHWKISMKEEV